MKQIEVEFRGPLSFDDYNKIKLLFELSYRL